MLNLIKRNVAKAAITFAGNSIASEVLHGVLPVGKRQPPRRGTQQVLESYKHSPWLHAVVGKISTGVASVDWKLFVARDEAGNPVRNMKAQRFDAPHRRKILKGLDAMGNLEELEDHPLLDVLSGGNGIHPGLVLGQLTQQYLEMVGEAYWIKERNELGMPVRLWPVPPHWITDIARPDKPSYTLNYQELQAEIPVTEVVYFIRPDPVNPYTRGTGTANALGDEIETDEFAAKHTKQFFFNSAVPELIVSGPKLSPENTKRLEEKWLNTHRGFWNRFKPAFLSGDIKVETLSSSLRDMQLTDLRQHERDAIVQVHGVPPELLGILTNSNRATIESAEFFFTRHVLEPRLEFLRVYIQEQLIRDFDERLILDYESPVQEDKEHKLKVAKAAPWAFSINEWREMAGLPELSEETDGDNFMVPGNLTSSPTQTIGAPPPPEPAALDELRGEQFLEDVEKPDEEDTESESDTETDTPTAEGAGVGAGPGTPAGSNQPRS